MFGRFLAFLFAVFMAFPAPLTAQEAMTGLARLTGEGMVVTDRRSNLTFRLDITQPVPWRVFTLTDPARLVVDFSELDWTGMDADTLVSGLAHADAIRTGAFRPGWSRMVVDLTAPMIITRAGMEEGAGTTQVTIRLEPSDDETFVARSGAPANALFTLAETEGFAATAPLDGDRMTIVLDPGHGGIDPGAERGGVREADLTLAFARELKDVLLRQGHFDVVLTRDEDIFVPLEERVSIARRAGADVFLSLHADALAEGRATGATVYTLAEEASDIASEKLAERHDREDLLAGVDLTKADDAVALVLMDLARTDTAPRSAALADALVEGIYSATQSTYKTPRMQAAFSVLKAPDIPSALIELGFLSSAQDREKLTDPVWRRQAAEGIRDALLYWSLQDAALAERLRQ